MILPCFVHEKRKRPERMWSTAPFTPSGRRNQGVGKIARIHGKIAVCDSTPIWYLSACERVFNAPFAGGRHLNKSAISSSVRFRSSRDLGGRARWRTSESKDMSQVVDSNAVWFRNSPHGQADGMKRISEPPYRFSTKIHCASTLGGRLDPARAWFKRSGLRSLFGRLAND